MPDISQSVRSQAAAIQNELNSAVKSIKANSNLTPDGKQRQLAAAYLRAEQKMGGTKDSWQASATKTSKVLSKDIFGAVNTSGVDAISVRDAADRAGQIEDPTEAGRLLNWAEDNGDQVLARAIAQRSYDQSKTFFGSGWGEVLNGYTESRPDVATKIDDLEAARRNGVANAMDEAVTFSLSKPTELDRVRNLAALAEAAE